MRPHSHTSPSSAPDLRGQERRRRIAQVLWSILGLNLLVALAKLYYGYRSRALGLTADGVHSLLDGASNVVGIVGISAAGKPADRPLLLKSLDELQSDKFAVRQKAMQVIAAMGQAAGQEQGQGIYSIPVTGSGQPERLVDRDGAVGQLSRGQAAADHQQGHPDHGVGHHQPPAARP